MNWFSLEAFVDYMSEIAPLFVIINTGFPQISLLEMPEHQRKKMMSLTTNIMRDDTDKVIVDV